MTQLTVSPNKQVASVRDFLNQPAVKKQIVAALPKHLTPERMIRVITTAITNTPKLAECTRDSLIAAIVEATTLGLEPNTSLGEAYLIPYGKVAKLIIGYRGFINLALRSGEVSFAVSEIVYANDLFKMRLGTSREIIHEPLMTGDRGEWLGVYSLIQYKDGVTDFEYMSAEEVEKIKQRSKASQDGPWISDPGEMRRKTPMRRHAKRWPLSPEVAARVAQDEYIDYGLTQEAEIIPPKPVITPAQASDLVKLAKANKVSNEQLAGIHKEFGFEFLAKITVDAYEDVKAAILNTNAIDGTPDPDQPPDTSEVTTESEGDSVCKALREQLFAMVEGPGGWGILQLGTGQKARYKNRANLEQDELQKLVDELTK